MATFPKVYTRTSIRAISKIHTLGPKIEIPISLPAKNARGASRLFPDKQIGGVCSLAESRIANRGAVNALRMEIWGRIAERQVLYGDDSSCANLQFGGHAMRYIMAPPTRFHPFNYYFSPPPPARTRRNGHRLVLAKQRAGAFLGSEPPGVAARGV